MRVNNGKDWCRALDPNDRQYGVERLAICDQTALVRHLARHSHRLPEGIDQVFANVGRYDCYEQRELMTRFYRCYPRYYMDHVVASGVLEVPVGLGNGYYRTEEVLARLKGAAPPTNYAFAVGEPADGKWSKAIAMLRERIGLSPEGGYTQEAAEKLYVYGRNRWRTGRGYLYSDNNPDILFNSGYQDYVTVVTFTVWQEIGLDVDYLREDDHVIWTKIDTDPSKVMYDMHGRTTGLDEYKGSLLPTLWRVLTSYPNAVMLDVTNDSQLGVHMTLEVEDEFWLRKLFNQAQRVIWAGGAEVMYATGKEFTWYTLMNSLSDNPQPIIVEEGVSNLFDDIIAKFKRNSYVQGVINSFLADKTDSFPRTETAGLEMELAGDYDLFAAVNKCKMWMTGEKNEDISWDLYVELEDNYDFTEPREVFSANSLSKAIGYAANNAAIISQDTGAIITYPITIRFHMKDYIPSKK